MNWDVLATCAEIVGAFGVIASLVFLAVETRKNTTTMKASLSNDVLTASAELNDVIMANPELREAASKSLNPNSAVDDFSTAEKDTVIYLARATLMRYEGVYMLYKQGLVERSVWDSRRALAAGLIQLPIWSEYWKMDKDIGLYTEEFVEAVSNADAAEFKTPISALEPNQ
jgi:hypothetical protein